MTEEDKTAVSGEHVKSILRQNEDIQKAFGLLPWLPAMFLTIYAFVFTLFILVVYYAVTGWGLPVTNGQVLMTLVMSIVVAAIVGTLARVFAGRKMVAKMKSKGIM